MKLKLGALRRSRTPPAAVGSYRVALHGFSDFERNALTFCLKHAAAREPAYLHVDRAADADFIVADASHEALTTSVTRGARLHDTLFVGGHAPLGARAQVDRPIDPEKILRALDELAAEREASPAVRQQPDIVLPMAPKEIDFPTLSEVDIVETTPAAFDHSPVMISLADLEPIARPRARGPAATPLSTPAAPVKQPGAWRDANLEAAATKAAKPAPEPTVEPMPAAEPGTAAGEQAGAAREPAPAAHDDSPQPLPGDAAQPASAREAPPSRRARAAAAFSPEEFDTIAPGSKPSEAPAAAPAAAIKPQATALERAEAKAAARRRSRRARLAQAGHPGAEPLRDVLLLAPQNTDAGLAAQLEAFGFRVRHAIYSADALALVADMPLAALFVDVAPGSDEDMDGLELCMEIKHQRVVLAGAVPPVFLLANRDSAAGRVRAKLAGCDALLIRPVSRGDAARALEACDVVLPKDERRVERS